MTSVAAQSDSFYAQEAFQIPGTPDMLGLFCPRCGDTTLVELAWVLARQGDRMGCAACGGIYHLPMVSE